MCTIKIILAFEAASHGSLSGEPSVGKTAKMREAATKVCV